MVKLVITENHHIYYYYFVFNDLKTPSQNIFFCNCKLIKVIIKITLFFVWNMMMKSHLATTVRFKVEHETSPEYIEDLINDPTLSTKNDILTFHFYVLYFILLETKICIFRHLFGDGVIFYCICYNKYYIFNSNAMFVNNINTTSIIYNLYNKKL